MVFIRFLIHIDIYFYPKAAQQGQIISLNQILMTIIFGFLQCISDDRFTFTNTVPVFFNNLFIFLLWIIIKLLIDLPIELSGLFEKEWNDSFIQTFISKMMIFLHIVDIV